MKKVDPNQVNLFADFGMEVPEPIVKKKVERVYEPFVSSGERKTDNEMTLWFAKQCKQSLAFLDAVLNGELPGDYHGTKLWMRRFGNLWTNELREDAQYWIDRDYKIMETPDTVCLIKIK